MRTMVPRTLAPGWLETRRMMIPSGVALNPPSRRFVANTLIVAMVLAFVGASLIRGQPAIGISAMIRDWFPDRGGTAPELPIPPEPDTPDDSDDGHPGDAVPLLPDGYAYVVTDSNGNPVLTDACRPVTYTLDRSGIPDEAEAALLDAVAEVAELTGLSIVPEDSMSDGGLDIDIEFAPERADDRLAESTIGVTQTRPLALQARRTSHKRTSRWKQTGSRRR